VVATEVARFADPDVDGAQVGRTVTDPARSPSDAHPRALSEFMQFVDFIDGAALLRPPQGVAARRASFEARRAELHARFSMPESVGRPIRIVMNDGANFVAVSNADNNRIHRQASILRKSAITGSAALILGCSLRSRAHLTTRTIAIALRVTPRPSSTR
jgi:hypothetical protein